jgi:hypothetical protein
MPATAAGTRQNVGSATLDPVVRIGGVGIALGVVISAFGGIWDIQWHDDVGPDTFFTAPHLFLYAGATLVGLSAMAVVLACTWLVAKGAAAAGPPLTPLLGRTFWGPPAFVVAGCGALTFLLFGLFDLWWHEVYGFDAVLDSPPHTGLGLGDLISITGAVAVGTLLVGRARNAGRLRLLGLPVLVLAGGAAVFLVNSASWQVGFAGSDPAAAESGLVRAAAAGALDGQLLFAAAVVALALLAVASVVRLAGAATLTALVFTLICAGSWVFSAWATPLYAEVVGLYPRDTAFGFPRIVAVLPDFVLAAAVAIDGVLAWARRRDLPVRRGVALAGGIGMAVLAIFEIAVPNGPLVTALPLTSAAAMVMAAALIGALAGWAGWKLGVVLGRLGGDPATPAPRQPALARGGAVPRAAAATVAVLAALLAAPTAGAVEPVAVVHRETTQAGPYAVSVGFSEWPMQAERSLDILFDPEGGIADKTGTLTLIAPSGAEDEVRLVRHPRARESWGLDIVALPEPGRWSLRFAIEGPEGPGVGRLSISLLDRPGPPVLVGWLPALAVSGAMIGAVVVAWRRARPAKAPETWSWGWTRA